MTQNDIRSVVEQHSPVVLGTRYSLKLEWLVVEQDLVSKTPTYRLRIQCFALEETTTAPMQMRVLVRLTRLSDIPAVLDQALHEQLASDVSIDRSEDHRPQRLRFTAALQRGRDALRLVWRHQA